MPSEAKGRLPYWEVMGTCKGPVAGVACLKQVDLLRVPRSLGWGGGR